MGITSPIGKSQAVSTYPANYWQKGPHGGNTAQITGRTDKTWAVAHAYIVYKWPTDESGSRDPA